MGFVVLRFCELDGYSTGGGAAPVHKNPNSVFSGVHRRRELQSDGVKKAHASRHDPDIHSRGFHITEAFRYHHLQSRGRFDVSCKGPAFRIELVV